MQREQNRNDPTAQAVSATPRTLLALREDWQALEHSHDRVRALVRALFAQHDVPVP